MPSGLFIILLIYHHFKSPSELYTIQPSFRGPSNSRSSFVSPYFYSHFPSRQEDSRRKFNPVDDMVVPRSTDDWGSIDAFFDVADRCESLDVLKREFSDAKFWMRYALGLLTYEQEKTEHLEVVCTELDIARGRLENECMAIRLDNDKVHAEVERLTRELTKLNKERDNLIGRLFGLEQQFESSGQSLSSEHSVMVRN